MTEIDKSTIKIGLIFILLSFLLIIAMLYSGGCVSGAKNAYHGIVDTPTPTPTPEPTTPEPTPTPTPEPTQSEKEYMLEHNGYELREWVQWFRPDVEGIGNGTGIRQNTGDLHTAVTIWGYKFLPSYRYFSVSWGRNFVVKPDYSGDQFLFIYAYMYSNGDDVRQYGMDYNHFAVQIKDKLYYPDFNEYPERRIVEFDNTQNYARTSTIQPYGYKIVQDLQTGVITAEKQEWLMSSGEGTGNRTSNAWDGYIIFQVPGDTKPNDVKVIGNFANLAPQSYWQLR